MRSLAASPTKLVFTVHSTALHTGKDGGVLWLPLRNLRHPHVALGTCIS